MEKTYPLIIVFYLDREMMKNKQIIAPFAESVNMILAEKNANAMAFFLPTDGEERVECINPLIVPEVDMSKINKMVEDIKVAFSVGADSAEDVPEIEIIPGVKTCECGAGEECKCEKNN